MKKIIEILGSIRFWQAVLAGAVWYLGTLGYIPSGLVEAILGVCGVSIGVRTVDKLKS